MEICEFGSKSVLEIRGEWQSSKLSELAVEVADLCNRLGMICSILFVRVLLLLWAIL